MCENEDALEAVHATLRLYCVNFGAPYATRRSFVSTALRPLSPPFTLHPALLRTTRRRATLYFSFITLSICDYAVSNYGRAAREQESRS